MTITLNLLEELGSTNQRLLKISPALTLHPDGRLTVWSQWHYSEMDEADLLTRGKYSLLRKWQESHSVVNLASVRKIRYFEDLEMFIMGGMDMSTMSHEIQFFRALHADTKAHFSLDPLWLALPQVRQFLAQHVPDGIRNDFDPARNWLLRRRISSTLLGRPRELRTTSQVISDYGTLTWDHETTQAKVEVFGTGRGRRATPARLFHLSADGDLAPALAH